MAIILLVESLNINLYLLIHLKSKNSKLIEQTVIKNLKSVIYETKSHFWGTNGTLSPQISPFGSRLFLCAQIPNTANCPQNAFFLHFFIEFR